MHRNDRHRSIDLELLAPLFALNTDWISLQYERESPPHPRLHSPAGPLKDFADTAAIIDCLDLVITVDTAVAHLAGAMGKPVFTLLPFNSDWRWLLDRDDSPWYPSLRLFRQQHPDSWGDVIARVGTATSSFVDHSG